MTTDSDENHARGTPAPAGSFIRDVVPALLWTATIFVLGGAPNPGPNVAFDLPLDKVEHALSFGLLQILALRALRYELPGAWPRALPWVAAVASTAAGGALELYQLTVPNRSADIQDFLADAVGAGIAAFVTARLTRSSGPKLPSEHRGH